jgi:hypothetical protein
MPRSGRRRSAGRTRSRTRAPPRAPAPARCACAARSPPPRKRQQHQRDGSRPLTCRCTLCATSASTSSVPRRTTLRKPSSVASSHPTCSRRAPRQARAASTARRRRGGAAGATPSANGLLFHVRKCARDEHGGDARRGARARRPRRCGSTGRGGRHDVRRSFRAGGHGSRAVDPHPIVSTPENDRRPAGPAAELAHHRFALGAEARRAP